MTPPPRQNDTLKIMALTFSGLCLTMCVFDILRPAIDQWRSERRGWSEFYDSSYKPYFNGLSLPDSLNVEGTTLVTPIGVLVFGRGGWCRETTIPSKWPIAPQVESCRLRRIDIANGFFEVTPEMQGHGRWDRRCPQGTPEDWVYVSRPTNSGVREFWVSPAHLASLPW